MVLVPCRSAWRLLSDGDLPFPVGRELHLPQGKRKEGTPLLMVLLPDIVTCTGMFQNVQLNSPRCVLKMEDVGTFVDALLSWC